MRLLLSALLFVAGTTALLAAPQKPLAVTAGDKGKTLTVKVGQEIMVSLEGNITTGYAWELAKIDGQAVVLDSKVEYKSDKHPEGMAGGGGMFHAKFKTLKPGKATIKMEYGSPFAEDKKPAETFEVTLSVEK